MYVHYHYTLHNGRLNTINGFRSLVKRNAHPSRHIRQARRAVFRASAIPECGRPSNCMPTQRSASPKFFALFAYHVRYTARRSIHWSTQPGLSACSRLRSHSSRRHTPRSQSDQVTRHALPVRSAALVFGRINGGRSSAFASPELVMTFSQAENPSRTADNGWLASTWACVIPVSSMQKALNCGASVGRTYWWYSERMRPEGKWTRTAGNSVGRKALAQMIILIINKCYQ